jgi:hypothetical protein
MSTTARTSTLFGTTRSSRRRRAALLGIVSAVLVYGVSYVAARRAHLLVHYRSCPPPYDDRVDLPDPGIPMRWFLGNPNAVPWGYYAYAVPAVVFRPFMLVEQACWWVASPWRAPC